MQYCATTKSHMNLFFLQEAVVWRCSRKKVCLKISQNSQKNTYVGVSFKKRVQQSCFPVNFAKILRRPLFTEHTSSGCFCLIGKFVIFTDHNWSLSKIPLHRIVAIVAILKAVTTKWTTQVHSPVFLFRNNSPSWKIMLYLGQT